jgi:hypothetical protein
MNLLGFNISKLNRTTEDNTKKTKELKNAIAAEYHYRVKKTLKDWDMAMYQAKHPEKGMRDYSYLQFIYDQMMDDGTISGAIENRIRSSIQSSFNVYRGDDITDEYYSFFNKPWFYDFCTLFLESKYYGYSVIELGDYINESIDGAELIQRHNCVPEYYYVRKGVMIDKDKHIYYKDNKFIFNVIDKSLGLLNKLVPLWIYKKEAIKAWAIYAEKFGTPVRIGRTPSNDDIQRRELLDYLKNLGQSSSIVLNMEEQIEFLQTQNSDSYNVYERLIKLINEEIKKTIIGSTMTMDDGSSYSQSKTHENTFRLRVNSDIKDLQFFLNMELLPRLQELSFLKNDDIHIEFDLGEKLSLKERSAFDIELIKNGYELDHQYLINTYDTEISSKKEKPNPFEFKKEKNDDKKEE